MADPSRPVTGYPAPPSSFPQPNGYPYPAPPPPRPPPSQPPPPNYAYAYTYDPSAASRAAFFRRMITAMLAFFIISASVVFIVWLVLRPRLPKFWVDSVTVTNLNTSSSQTLSGDWTVGFSVYNPNKKMSIAYDEINSDISYRKAFLSETRIAPFDQGKRDRKVVNATFSARNSYVENWVVRGISEDRGRGTVNFHVRVWARVGFRTGGWRLRRRLLRVVCENVGVGVSSNSGSGKLVGGSKECRVGI